ncbi:DNA-binding transcriptional repressor DeoR [Actinobacillus porcinus]|uniref:DNA-binding transcriptional repressor DeoR n=1 Tax=Actinobacillus porcinus TaxID=51048 RepID=UPI0023551163|nr:DNA-binding transcriptional repressor DeoR [Actinobacillus porcinus]
MNGIKGNSRLQKLEFLLDQVDKIHLRDAAEILNVSEMTIRRDLSNHQSIFTLLGGYIVKESQKANNYFLLEQQDKNINEKMYIGKLAASLIENDDIVFFDCGTTISFIASQIPNSIKFTAVCCSMNTFLILQEKTNCEIILCGGKYSRDNALVSSIQNDSILDSICTTKAFIATSGVHPKYGLTCFRFNEAQIKQKAIAKTMQAITIFDHTKLNEVHPAYIGTTSMFDLAICNKTIPESFGFSRVIS